MGPARCLSLPRSSHPHGGEPMATRNTHLCCQVNKFPGEDALGRVGQLHTKAQSKGDLFAELLGQNNSGTLSTARATSLNHHFRSTQPRGSRQQLSRPDQMPAKPPISHPTSCPAHSCWSSRATPRMDSTRTCPLSSLPSASGHPSGSQENVSLNANRGRSCQAP